MFILTDERLTWMPVSVPRLDAAGNPTTQKLRVQVVLVDYDRFLEITNEQGPGEERNIIHELARDWDGVQARQGDSCGKPGDNQKMFGIDKNGKATITWKKVHTRGKTKTTAFKIETGLSKFSPTHLGGLPKHGRHSHVFHISAKARSLVLNPRRLALIGAPAGSGAAIFYRMWSIHKKGKKRLTRTDGHLHVATVRGQASSSTNPLSLTIASYNIRNAKAQDRGVMDLNTSNNWFKDRQSRVVANIAALKPDIVSFQEDIPTEITGPYNPDNQVDSLQQALKREPALASKDYQLNRSTPYAAIPGALQGVRVMYDANRFSVVKSLSKCSDAPDPNPSCSIKQAPLSGDPARLTRWASYVALQAKDPVTHAAVGKPFWVVSIHLDARTAGTKTQQTRYCNLRARQIQTVITKMNQFNSAYGYPIIVAGDLNDWQNNPASNGWAPHDTLIKAGYFDTADAARTINLAYPTVNAFRPLYRDGSGIGVRYDAIFTKGVRGANVFENRTFRVNGKWPSDHNMIDARITLP